MLAYTAQDDKITLVNPHTGKEIIKIDIQSEPIVSVVFSADGRTLYHSFYVNELKLWNPLTGELIHNLKKHSANVTALVYNSDTKIVGMTGTGEPFEMFDVGHETRTFKGYSNGIMTQAHSPNGQFTARTGTDLDCGIELLERQTGQTIRVLTGHKAVVQSLAFSPDSQILASISAEDLKLWQVETGKEIYDRRESSRRLMSRYSPTVGFTEVDSAENPVLMSSDFYALFERIYDRPGLNWGGGGSTGSVACVFLSTDRKVLARLFDNQPVQLWNLQTREDNGCVNLDSDYNYALALSPTGNLLAVRSRREFALFDVQTKTLIHKFTSPDGKWLASTDRSVICLWKLERN